MSTEIKTDAIKLRLVESCTIARATSPMTQQALTRAGTLLRLERRERLFHQGEPATTIALLGNGDVRLCRQLAQGSTWVRGYRSTGELVGEEALGGTATHDSTAVAMRDTEALCVPREVVAELLAKDAALCGAVVRLLVARRRAADDELVATLSGTMQERLACFLLAAASRWGLPEPGGVRIAASLTHAEIANAIGSTRETVTLMLGTLRRSGVIALDRRQVVIMQRDSLDAIASTVRAAQRGERTQAAVDH